MVFETHKGEVGRIHGFSVRVYRPDGTVTDAFRAVCKIREKLDRCPYLDDSDYSDRLYNATLKNYRYEMGKEGKTLPKGWAAEVYDWFGDNGLDRYTEDQCNRGGRAPKDAILEALRSLGM